MEGRENNFCEQCDKKKKSVISINITSDRKDRRKKFDNLAI